LAINKPPNSNHRHLQGRINEILRGPWGVFEKNHGLLNVTRIYNAACEIMFGILYNGALGWKCIEIL
jgi:hypothetical protein